ncbi:MAG TPA: hypothetical protein VNP73_01140, partial [Actinomycetota bacterium]|nr:hypothetical protein [Actinomycetota bacterium]
MGAVEPQRTGEVLGAGSVLVGMQLVAFDEAILLAIATGVMVGIASVGVARDRTAALAVGAVGLVVLVPQLITEVFGPSLGAMGALAISGLLVIAVAVFIARKRRD